MDLVEHFTFDRRRVGEKELAAKDDSKVGNATNDH